MAEDIVAGHPLLMTTAVLSDQCVEKLEILRKKFSKNRNNLFTLF
jgi:hypothetical protein